MASTKSSESNATPSSPHPSPPSIPPPSLPASPPEAPLTCGAEPRSSNSGPSATRAVAAGVATTAADAPSRRAGVRVHGDAGERATFSSPAGNGRRPSSLRRAAATDAPTTKAVVCALAADPAVGFSTWRPRAAAGAAGAIAGAAATCARQQDCGPPAAAGPVRAADRLRGGAGDDAAPGGVTARPRAPDGEADRPHADAGVADAAGGPPVARPPPTAASVPGAAEVFPVLVVAAAALSVVPAVATAVTLSSLSTRVTTPWTLYLGGVGLFDADDGTTVEDATGAAGVAPSFTSASVATLGASRSLGAGVGIDVVGGRADGGAPAAVVDVGGVATDDGGVAAVGVDGGAAAAANAARAWTDDDPVLSPAPSAGTTPAMASASASPSAGAPPAAVALGGDAGTGSRVEGGGAPWGGGASSGDEGARG